MPDDALSLLPEFREEPSNQPHPCYSPLLRDVVALHRIAAQKTDRLRVVVVVERRRAHDRPTTPLENVSVVAEQPVVRDVRPHPGVHMEGLDALHDARALRMPLAPFSVHRRVMHHELVDVASRKAGSVARLSRSPLVPTNDVHLVDLPSDGQAHDDALVARAY